MTSNKEVREVISSNHYYTFNGKRYENMKEACEGMNINSKFFKEMVQRQLVLKYHY